VRNSPTRRPLDWTFGNVGYLEKTLKQDAKNPGARLLQARTA
jgi:hypothetical protein